MIAETVDERTEETTGEKPEETVESGAVNEEKETELSEPEVRSKKPVDVEPTEEAPRPQAPRRGRPSKAAAARKNEEVAPPVVQGGDSPRTPAPRRGRPSKASAARKNEEVAPPVVQGGDSPRTPAPRRGRPSKAAAARKNEEVAPPVVQGGDSPRTPAPRRGRPSKASAARKNEEVAPPVVQGGDSPRTPAPRRGRPSKAAAARKNEEVAPPVVQGGDSPRTPAPRRGRPSKAAAAHKTEATPEKRTRRTTDVSDIASVKRGKRTKTALTYEDFITWEAGQRVLSCGEGEQLGHPGRRTTKKPRKVDIVEDEEMVVAQVVAGGVHSAFLTVDGTVYSCGINEKGTVPADGVEAEGSTDEFKKIVFSDEIKKHGKIVMLSAGASFTAALTDKGSVIAWGNLRDASGMIDVHQQLVAMQTHPIVVIHHKHDLVIVKVAAGENHLVMLSSDGRVFTFGDSSMGQLGRSVRLNHVRSQYMASENSLVVPLLHKRKSVKCKNIFAGGFWTAMLSMDNEVFVCGLNNFAHLGIPTEEMKAKEEVADKPEGTETDDRELRIMRPELSTHLTGQNWTNFDGVQHIAVRNDKGEIYCIGKNTDNALGLGTWSESDRGNNWKYDTLQKLDIEECSGVAARLGCSIAWTPSGNAYAWGFDSNGQLGLGLKDDDEKIVPKPEKMSSAHLDGYKIVQVSVADNHALFLAVKTD